MNSRHCFVIDEQTLVVKLVCVRVCSFLDRACCFSLVVYLFCNCERVETGGPLGEFEREDGR